MSWSKIMTKDLLTEMYSIKNMKVIDITEIIGCSENTVIKYLKQYGLHKVNVINIEEVKKFAILRGGKCLSIAYINSSSQLKWSCEDGHIWDQSWKNVRRGDWCKRCSAIKSNECRKLGVGMFQKIARDNAGECLSIKYVNSHTKMTFKCVNGHIWSTEPRLIKNGAWCKRCRSSEGRNKNIDKIELYNEMKSIAKQRGGDCLATAFENSFKKVKWRCVEGHTWMSSQNSVKSGSWCEKCNQLGGIKEEKCRTILEELLGNTFEKTRKILGNNLELDGYNIDLNLAFEYHGEQHYFFIKKMHRTFEKFEQRKELDKIKLSLCESKGINLITIPYWESNTNENLINFIQTKLFESSIPFNKNKKVVLSNIYKSSKLERLHEIAKSKNGKCLSDYYDGAKSYYTFVCKNGHNWKAKAVDISSQGTWCQKCYGNKKYTIQQMQFLALKLGGECLSTEYKSNRENIEWKCNKNHTFKKPFGKIVSNLTWCSVCRKNDKKNIEEVIEEMKQYI